MQVRDIAVEEIVLTPVQRQALEKVEELMTVTPVVGLSSIYGLGRTTILKQLARRHGGRLLSLSDVTEATAGRTWDASDAAIGSLILRTLEEHDLVLVDDLHSLNFPQVNTRPQFWKKFALKSITDLVRASGKRLILAGMPSVHQWESGSDLFSDTAAVVEIPLFSADDYAALAKALLGERLAKGIDFQAVFRYASMLNAHQLRVICALLKDEAEPTTHLFIDYLDRFVVRSTTRLSEVEELSFDSLPGAEHIAAKLETHVVLPLKNRELAQRLDLKPKRGVLLYGPPGTGKTSIGRALAHRIGGKFFLIDGSFVTEPPAAFFKKLQAVVDEAKRHSPSVLFIDDADVLFRIEHISGLSRYLLSLLDGLESETASNVCVMMTAMDARRIPEALLRSGRVELWLETRFPGEQTRAGILRRWMSRDLPDCETLDHELLGEMTEGFTPADLRRIASDAKSLYAVDRIRKQGFADATTYVRRAIDNLVATRDRMAVVLGDETLRIGGNRPAGKYAKGVGGAAQMGTCPAKGW